MEVLRRNQVINIFPCIPSVHDWDCKHVRCSRGIVMNLQPERNESEVLRITSEPRASFHRVTSHMPRIKVLQSAALVFREFDGFPDMWHVSKNRCSSFSDFAQFSIQKKTVRDEQHTCKCLDRFQCILEGYTTNNYFNCHLICLFLLANNWLVHILPIENCNI